MKSGLEYFLADVKSLTKQKPPFNDAFTFRCLNVLGTAVTVIEGLKIIIDKNKAELDNLKGPTVKVEKPKGVKATKNVEREAAIVADYEAGMKKNHIAEKYKLSAARVSQILERNGFPPVAWKSRP